MNQSEFFQICLTLSEINLDKEKKNKQLKVRVGIETMLYWKKRSQYLELFNDFLEKNIDSDSFSIIIDNWSQKTCDDVELIVLNLTKKAKNQENLDAEFSEISEFIENEQFQKMAQLFTELLMACECLSFDMKVAGDGYYVTEHEFKIQVQNIISNLELCFQH